MTAAGNNELLRRLGLFIVDQFLPTELCAQIMTDVRAQAPRQATIGGSARVVEETVRRTSEFRVGHEAKSAVTRALEDLKPDLERSFGVTLEGFEKPALLGYGGGDFFTPHRDVGGDPATDQRSVSVSVFLNAPAAGDDDSDAGFRGGALTFYGLFGGDEGPGIPVAARPGMLVAFPSPTLHEVRPVEAGHRYTIVTWFRTA